MASRPKIRRRRRTKIIATLGPASSSPEVLARLFQAGADVFRLNFSHGTHEDHAARFAMIRELEERFDRPIGILRRRAGPEAARRQFRRRARVSADRPGFQPRPQPHARRCRAGQPAASRRSSRPPSIGATLLLDDGKLRLRVARKRGDALETEVVVGGPLSDRKGVNVPDIVLPIPALTEKDRDDLAFALEHGANFIGLSFVQRPEDVAEAQGAGRAAAPG